MVKKEYYIYKITNKVNGKIYIGQHYGSLTDGYLGSGVRLLRAFNKYGRKNFIKQILCTCTAEEIDDLEKRYIKDCNSQDSKVGYNATEGGTSNVWQGKKWSEVSTPEKCEKRLEKKRQRDAQHWTEENRTKLGEAVREKQWSGEKGKRRRQIFSKRYKGRNNPSAKAYKVITPTETIIVVDGLRYFCKERGLVWDTIRKHVNKGVVGRSNKKDTSLFKKKSKTCKGTKQKIYGWEIIEISKQEAFDEIHNI